MCERVFLSRKYLKTKYTIISCDDEFYNPDGLLDCINYLDKKLSPQYVVWVTWFLDLGKEN